MRVYKIYGDIGSFWDGTSQEYLSGLYKTKKRAEEDIPELEIEYSRKKGYNSKFRVYSVEVIE